MSTQLIETMISTVATSTREFRVHRKGWKIIPQSRTLYKEVFIKANVPSGEATQWLAFFACVAASAALTVALAATVLSVGITWPLVVAAIIAASAACFAAGITPDKLKSLSGSAYTSDRWGDWG